MNKKEKLLSAAPHFIRCIKANQKKVAKVFEEELVAKQLSYCGMLETTRIRREGFSSRPLFSDFVDRFKLIAFPLGADVPKTAESCRQVCETAGLTDYEVGKTKMFLRYFHQDKLNALVTPYHTSGELITNALVTPYHTSGELITNACRWWLARENFATKKAAYEAKKEAARLEAERIQKEKEEAERLAADDQARKEKEAAEEQARKEQEAQAQAAPLPPAADGGGEKKKKKKMDRGRAASVKCFKEVEAGKGSGKTEDGGFAAWFHGIINRTEAEALLAGQKSNTFLIRVAETRLGQYPFLA